MAFDLQKARDLAENPIHCPETDEIFREAVKMIEKLEMALIKERVRYNLLFPEMWSKEDMREEIFQAREQLQKEGLI